MRAGVCHHNLVGELHSNSGQVAQFWVDYKHGIACPIFGTYWKCY